MQKVCGKFWYYYSVKCAFIRSSLSGLSCVSIFDIYNATFKVMLGLLIVVYCCIANFSIMNALLNAIAC